MYKPKKKFRRANICSYCSFCYFCCILLPYFVSKYVNPMRAFWMLLCMGVGVGCALNLFPSSGCPCRFIFILGMIFALNLRISRGIGLKTAEPEFLGVMCAEKVQQCRPLYWPTPRIISSPNLFGRK